MKTRNQNGLIGLQLGDTTSPRTSSPLASGCDDRPLVWAFVRSLWGFPHFIFDFTSESSLTNEDQTSYSEAMLLCTHHTSKRGARDRSAPFVKRRNTCKETSFSGSRPFDVSGDASVYHGVRTVFTPLAVESERKYHIYLSFSVQ